MMKFVIKFDYIPDTDIPTLGKRPRDLGITLTTRRQADCTTLKLEAPTKIDNDFISKLIEG